MSTTPRDPKSASEMMRWGLVRLATCVALSLGASQARGALESEREVGAPKSDSQRGVSKHSVETTYELAKRRCEGQRKAAREACRRQAKEAYEEGIAPKAQAKSSTTR